MVKKKRAKKVIKRNPKKVKKIIKKSKVKRVVNKPKKLVRSTKRKISLVLKNFVLFVVISLVSLALHSVSNNDLFKNLFLLLVIISGFVAVAFLIVFLIFLFLKLMKK